MPGFDAVAADFDRFRALPSGVPETIRAAFWNALACPPGARLLDLGAGTGRIGDAFVAAGDAYVAVEPSAGMLARFAAKATLRGRPAPRLVQADGRTLPFADAAFDAVLLVQVLSGAPGWRRLLAEAKRVLRPGGALVLAKTVRPPDGIDARMRAQLSEILAEMGIDERRPGADRDEARGWLAPEAQRLAEVVAARWDAPRSPRDFLDRHATGARFTALPKSVREESLERLAQWAVETFGSLDVTINEPHTFMLDVCVF
jgi:ubiquinone/menaquinone biosynthesis C-methylase UbiE